MSTEHSTETAKRGLRKVRTGTVVSNRAKKTIIVEVTRTAPHPMYRKVIKMRGKFAAHDEKSEAQIGDIVKIMETRPLSKTKRWRLLEIVSKNVDNVKSEA